MFFNPLNKASVDPNYKVLATAQLTVTDQTDASNLAGNMTVVSGSKSQMFLTGSSQPYNPDYKVSNLVLRPYMIATNVYRGSQDNRYNPDLFDPKEYPNLEKPGDVNVSVKYIHDIEWYIVDSANNQKLINIEEDTRFSHTWTYRDAEGEETVLSDKRTLVIKDNILEKDQVASIMVKFSFNDPFADIRIPVTYEVQINNLSTGVGTSKAAINSMDGNSFYNADEDQQLRFKGDYYSEGVYVDLDQRLQDPTSNTRVEWFIRTQNGWTILDAATQDDNQWNQPGKMLYEIHRVVEKDHEGNIIRTEKTKNPKGGTVLIITPGLIAGSDIIRFTVTDDQQSDMQSNALENVHDYSDPTQCYIWSSNGDKLYKGMEAPGTNLKAVVTYRGTLLEDEDSMYNTAFDYYWYRIDGSGTVVENIYEDQGVLKFIDTKDPNYTSDNGFPKKLNRSIDIHPNHIDNKATFTVDLLNKKEALVKQYRANLLRSMPTEEELKDAKIIAVNSGLSPYAFANILDTAIEMRAFKIAQEENILAAYKQRRGE